MMNLIFIAMNTIISCMPICDAEYPESISALGLISDAINLNHGFTYVDVIRDTFDYSLHSKLKANCNEYGAVVKITAILQKFSQLGVIRAKNTRVIYDTTPFGFECPMKSNHKYKCITRQKDSLKCGETLGRSGKGAMFNNNDCGAISMKIGETTSGLIYGEIGAKDSVQYKNCPHPIKSKNWIPVINDTIVISNTNKKQNIPLPKLIMKFNAP